MTLFILSPLIVGCAAAGWIICWPIAKAAGVRSVSDVARARDAAEIARIGAGIFAQASTIGAGPRHWRHRITWRQELRDVVWSWRNTAAAADPVIVPAPPARRAIGAIQFGDVYDDLIRIAT